MEIRTRHDRILGVAEADESLRPGIVAMTHAFGGLPDEDDRHRELGSNTGRLTRADVEYEPMSGMPRLGAIPVAICRAAD